MKYPCETHQLYQSFSTWMGSYAAAMGSFIDFLATDLVPIVFFISICLVESETVILVNLLSCVFGWILSMKQRINTTAPD